MALAAHNLDDVSAAFPAWLVFRSDGGSFYATRRGERLSSEQLTAGLEQTVCADDLASFVSVLREQESRRACS